VCQTSMLTAGRLMQLVGYALLAAANVQHPKPRGPQSAPAASSGVPSGNPPDMIAGDCWTSRLSVWLASSRHEDIIA
jgi:hypothetical protein